MFVTIFSEKRYFACVYYMTMCEKCYIPSLTSVKQSSQSNYKKMICLVFII